MMLKRLVTVLVGAIFLYVPSAFSAIIYIADDQGAVAAYDDVTMLLAPVGDVSDTFSVSQNIGIAYDAANSRILLLDRSAPMVFAMDPANGNVTQLFNPGIEFQGGAVKNGLLYGVNEGTQELVAFDLTTFDPVAIPGGALPDHIHGTGIDSATGQLYVAGSSVYPIADDGTTGAALFALQTAAEDLDYYGGNFLVVDYGRSVFHYDNVGTETVFLDDTELAAAGVTGNLSGVVVASGEVVPVASNARFRVTKIFSDGSTDEVDVTLTCNTGLPLQQDFTIEGGDPGGVVFVVTQFEEGTMDCEVTESGGPSGYTPVFNGGGCALEDVVSGVYECVITNEANPAEFTVTKDWVIEGAVRDEVILEAQVTINCTSDILSIDGLEIIEPDGSVTAFLSGDGDSVTVDVDTELGPTSCSASESISQSGVESESDCGARTIAAGGSSSCTITNTVFFEGIPTLSQYGMALMALLMLGLGFVGLRRFV